MYNIIRQGDTDQNNILQYCCDIRENLIKLPTKDGAGSTCIILRILLYICLIQSEE